MIYLELLLGFLKVGCFSFGGAYGAIPLIRDVVMNNGWLTEEQLSYMIAISESTPGPIMVNMATYVGESQAGILGAIIATLAVVFPSFLIVILVVSLGNRLTKNSYVQAILEGVKPCIIGIILATGIHILATGLQLFEKDAIIDISAALIAVCLLFISCLWKRLTGKKLSPIAIIVCGAVLGILFYT